MNAHAVTAYRLWPGVTLIAGLFILFAASFFQPRRGQDWRTRIDREALAGGAGALPTHGRTES